MTIYRNLLTRGYFPKELPPNFFTEQFAQYASSKPGRAVLENYKPSDNFTECFSYWLALPNLDKRELRTPHPYAFAQIASLTSKHFRRLLKKAAKSKFSKSRPIYETDHHRALRPMTLPANLAREKAEVRAASSYLLKVDVSQFYPSLYTHAVGWAIDPKLRIRSNWHNSKLLGKALDQALMNLQGKISQGVPIGNDVSFLLTEIVLAEVDRRIQVDARRSYRWFDDYEIACDSRDEAERLFARLSRELRAFRLRVNQSKFKILPLPLPSQEYWQQELREQSATDFNTAQNMVEYFDTAFRLHAGFPDSPVLMYALGILFKLRCPADRAGAVALSAATQALLAEPGVAQKAFSLMEFWKLNGFALDKNLLAHTVDRMIFRHETSGVSSDISWALAFCINNAIPLGKRACQILSTFEDDCIGIQALHARKLGLLPKGFSTKKLSRLLKSVDVEGEHWLLGYEAVRHGFLLDGASAVKANSLFSDLLKYKVTFYRTKLPAYATIIHPGGAPDWVVKSWIKFLRLKKVTTETDKKLEAEKLPILELMRKDLEKIPRKEGTVDQAITELLDLLEPKTATRLIARVESYFG